MENPVCTGQFDHCSPSSSTAVICDKDQVTFDYERFNKYNGSAKHTRHNNMMNKHRWLLPYCTIAAVVIACAALLGLVAVYVELRRSNDVLTANRDLIHAQDLKILNQTNAMDKFRTELKYMQGNGGGNLVASNQPGAAGQTGSGPENMQGGAPSMGSSGASGSVYFRWGVDDCPNSSTLIYSGIAASGSSLSIAKGSGGNIICMTPDPEYGHVVAGRQDPRARIFSMEYRNGGNFGDQSDLHGHDVPCAACQTTRGRQGVLMIPGRVTCPSGWTREYYGLLMSSRYNNMRTSYICVDIAAESRPGTMTEDGNSSLLYPVEGMCGSGGGLPCGPYVDGQELQCAVCSN